MTLRRLTMPSRRFPGLPLIGVLAIIYVIAGKIGLNLASLHASASPVWPPTGIALAALLLFGLRVWPAIFVGAWLVNVTTSGWPLTSLGIACGNTLEAAVGAHLINRFANGRLAFERSQDIFMCIPTLLWAVFRFGPPETATVVVGLSGLAVLGTLRGHGPFAGGTANESLLFLQAFMGTMIITLMPIASLVRESRRAAESLRE